MVWRTGGFSFVLSASLTCPLFAAADESVPKEKEASFSGPGEQLKALKEDLKKANAAVAESAKALRKDGKKASPAELQKFIKDVSAKREKLMAEAVAIARRHPDNPAALDALAWIMQLSRGRNVDEALDLLAEDHLKSPRLGEFCELLAANNSPRAEHFLRLAIKQSPHRDVQGRAWLSAAQRLERLAQTSDQYRKASPVLLGTLQALGGGDDFQRIKGMDAALLRKQAEEAYAVVVTKYADVMTKGGTLGEAAEPVLFEMRHLGIGKIAPEIEGEDLDGKPFKLSDYRGKVVVLDFWGNW